MNFEEINERLDNIEEALLQMKIDKANLKWCCERFKIRFGKPEFIKAEKMMTDEKKIEIDLIRSNLKKTMEAEIQRRVSEIERNSNDADKKTNTSNRET